MELDRYDLTKLEKDILLEFFEDSLNYDDLMDCVRNEYRRDFLIRLADNLNTFKYKINSSNLIKKGK